MPTYFFDVRTDAHLAPDREGSDFPDLDAAEAEAARVAGELGRDDLLNGRPRRIVVEIRNEHGDNVSTATLCLEIERTGPQPVNLTNEPR
jgi:hypothetical protein